VSTDTLSEVLRAVRLTGAVFFRVEGSPPWVAETPPAATVAPHILPGAEHVIEYHVITKGSCWGGLIGEPAIALREGDIVVFPQGDPHVMSSEPGMRAEPDLALHRRPERAALPIPISHGPSVAPAGGPGRAISASPDGVGAELVCGFLGCDARPFNPLLATLPRVLHVPGASSGDSHLAELVRLAVKECSARRPGSESMLASLSQLLFIEVVRLYVAALSHDTTGWLAGLRDEIVGRALMCLHDRPRQDWTLDDLAKEVGLSRSMLAERFHHFVGIPPMQYLARWRIQLAASLLTSSTFTLSEVAGRVGYGSEAALSRAFKRWVGVAPSSWRMGERLPERVT
jgi:AraC-like DNA-binding protein